MTPAPAPLQHLLAATDLSAPARLALQRAGLLAREHGAALTVAHVLNRGWFDEIADWLRQRPQLRAQLQEQARQSLAQETAVAAAGHPAQALLLDGEPVPALCEQARQCGADLVVAGARGGNPLHQLLIGGTAERLLRKTLLPLLVVRQPATQAYARVLVPLDFSPWSLAALRLARRVAPRATWVLHHSFTLAFEEKLRYAGVDEALMADYREHARHQGRANLLATAQAAGLGEDTYGLSLSEGDAPQRILDAARDQGCDLIAIGKHGRHAAEELLLGSVTRHVIEEATVDVLVSTAHG